MTTLPNLRKALYVRCSWRSHRGQVRQSEHAPTKPTFNGEPFDPNEHINVGDVTLTRLEHANCLGGVDKWTFNISIHFPASVTIDMTGEAAEKTWKAWKGVVFGSQVKD